MADPFVAEIRIFPFNFAPRGWALCNGQLMAISQNTALFSLLGTTYGGDGKSTFGLPNMQGSAPMEQGQGPGLSPHYLGEMEGTPAVTLLNSEMPVHNHTFNANGAVAQNTTPANEYIGEGAWTSGTNRGSTQTYTTKPPNAQMSPRAVSINGSSLPHNNMMPYLTVTFCIALQGVFPPRG